MEAGVKFNQFINFGNGLLNRQLGFSSLLFYFVNAVELQFRISSQVKNKYLKIFPTQWSGTESVWIKIGDSLAGQWKQVHSGLGTGLDDPEPQNVLVTEDKVAYFDSPGPNITKYQDANPSRIVVMQNFTGWIKGELQPNHSVNLCPPTAWHSVVSIVDGNWSEDSHIPNWQVFPGNRSGLGWVDVNTQPGF